MMVCCKTCGKNFSRNDAMTRHKKYSCSLSPTVQVKQNVAKCEESNSKPVDKMSQDIPTFDGAEFSGEKPKSEKTLVKIMDMLKIPNENRADILKEERKLDPSNEPSAKKLKIIPLLSKSNQQMPEQSSEKKGDEETEEEKEEDEKEEGESPPPVVKAPHLTIEEKKLFNKYSQLFRDMKLTGKDNRGKLCILLDAMRDYCMIDEAGYDKAYDAIMFKL